MEFRTLHYIRGKVLAPGEESRAVYGVIGTSKDRILRVSMTKEHAELLTGCDSRHIEEVFLSDKNVSICEL